MCGAAGAPGIGDAARAEEDGTELMVPGTHGRGAVGRALAGSVGSEVARAAPYPVLLVPQRMWRGRARRASADAALAVETAGR